MEPSAYIPPTVAAAVALFVLKELVEGYRRWAANRRKLSGIKHQFKVECELNYWFIHSLRTLLDRLEENEQAGGERPKVFVDTAGDTVVRFVLQPGQTGIRGMTLPPVVSSDMEKNILEAALLDKNLFNCMQPAIDAARELLHLRKSLVTYIDPLEIDANVRRKNFISYARKEAAKAQDALQQLYDRCGGHQLELKRLR